MIETRKPKLELLSKALVEQIVDEGLTLLERHGVLVENAEALDLLAGAGAGVDRETGRVRMGRKLVLDSLATTPSVITLYDRAGSRAFTVGGDEVHFDPGSAAVTLLDHDTGTERKASTADLVAFTSSSRPWSTSISRARASSPPTSRRRSPTASGSTPASACPRSRSSPGRSASRASGR